MPISQDQYFWAHHTLNSLGYRTLGDPIIIRDRPWSCVGCYKTSRGKVYLKSMAEPYANEANLLEFLNKKKIQHITHVISSNSELSCFLMTEAGDPLRENQISQFDLEKFCRYLEIYAKIQIICIPLVDDLLTINLPDWRVEILPELYKKFIQQRDLLINDGLFPSEIALLEQAHPVIDAICKRLGSYNIPETLEHGDFHDNNILIQGKTITINDWGDSTISHPFFSLAATLDSAKRNHQLQKSDHRYEVARDAYLCLWQQFGTLEQLREAFSIATTLHRFIFALGFSRIYSCPGIENFPRFKGYVAGSLRELLNKI